jgi:hypothetical protein
MRKLIDQFKNLSAFAIAALILVLGSSMVVIGAAVTQIAGLAVAGPGPSWDNVKDAGKFTDPQTRGISSTAIWLFTGSGSNFERLQGTGADGMRVQQKTVGTAFYANKRVDIAAASVNLAFGFTSRKVAIVAPSTNSDEICLDWLGGTAVCPAANTAGDARLAPGDSIIIDDIAVASVSVISSSGTQTINVQAWQ